MIAEVLLDKVWIKYQFAGSHEVEEPCYSYLEDVPPITESTTKESGSASIVLALAAYENLGLPLGQNARIREGTEVLFDGIIADVTIANSITLQLEA